MEEQFVSCQNCRRDFPVAPEDLDFYRKMRVLPPTFCPDCRLQRRLAFRNERTLYRRPCDSCNMEVLTMYAPEGKISSFCSPCWWSDKWSPSDYGQEYDFSKPFFTQFRELMERVPHPNLSVSYQTLVNSNFTNMNHALKNCYWLFNSDYDENCCYSEEVEHSKDCFDTTMIESSEQLYESLNCNKCYQTYFSVDCESSHNICFSKNLSGCSNCFGCINLRNKSYCIFNEQYTKEEYQKKLSEIDLSSYKAIQGLLTKVRAFWLTYPHKYMHGIQNVNVAGDYIDHSKNVRDSFIVTESENCKYCMWLIVKNNKDSYDFTQFGENTQSVYEAMCSGKNLNDAIGTVSVIESRAVRYCMYCFSNNSNLFGCIGLRNKQYCILNKQYLKEEYEELVPKIIEHMNAMPYKDNKNRRHTYGDFFPIEISQFAYNETSANEFFPMTKEQTEQSGYAWKIPKEKSYTITLKSHELPDSINDIQDNVLQQAISCEHEGRCNQQCATAFRIIPAEMQFYRTAGIPLPRLCPNCRHYERVKYRNPIKLHQRQCQCAGTTSSNKVYANTASHFHTQETCPNIFETSYAPDHPEIVYCEQCYQAEVI